MHTPGPWNDGMDSKGRPIIMQRYNDPYLRPEDINEEAQANLRLISAAPDLLDMLKSIEYDAEPCVYSDGLDGARIPIELFDELTALVKKIEGKE